MSGRKKKNIDMEKLKKFFDSESVPARFMVVDTNGGQTLAAIHALYKEGVFDPPKKEKKEIDSSEKDEKANRKVSQEGGES